MGKSHPVAKEAARHLAKLRPLGSPLFLQESGLCLLHGSDLSQHTLVSSFLHAPSPTKASQALNILGGREAIPVTPGRLGGWAWSLKWLRGQTKLEAWLKDGVRELRQWRTVDLHDWIETKQREFDRLNLWFTQHTWSCRLLQGDTSDEVLWHAWEAQHTILGAWPAPSETPLPHTPPPKALYKNASSATLHGWLLRHQTPTIKKEAMHTWEHTCQEAFVQGTNASCLEEVHLLAASPKLLSPLQDLPSEVLTKTLPLALQIHALYPLDEAAHILTFITKPLQSILLKAKAQRRKFDRFLQALQHLDTHQDTPLSWLQDLFDSKPQRQHRKLVQHLLSHVLDVQPSPTPNMRELTRLARDAHHDNQTWLAAGEALVAHVTQKDHHNANLNPKWLALALIAPSAKLAPTSHMLDNPTLDDWNIILSALPPTQAKDLWEKTHTQIKSPKRGWGVAKKCAKALNAGLDHDTFITLYNLGLWETVEGELVSSTKALQRFAAAVRAINPSLDDAKSNEPFWRQGWFANLFIHPHAWIEPFLIQATRNQSSHSTAQLIVHLQTLTQATRVKERGTLNILNQWQNQDTTLAHQSHASLIELLDLPHQTTHEYFAHQIRLGLPATLSKAAHAPLLLSTKRDKERQWLQETLKNNPKPPAHLSAKLVKLQDDAHHATALAQSVQRARHRVQRNLERLRAQSHDLLIQTLTRHALNRLVPNLTLPQRLNPKWGAMLSLLGHDNLPKELIVTFIHASFKGLRRPDTPQNQAWVTHASTQIDTTAWLQGFDLHFTIAGHTFRLATSDDPLEAVHMGTYLNTCLHLTTGCHAESALLNTIDANKQVIYLYNDKDQVIGRKLIGLTPSYQLAGFEFYILSHAKEIPNLATLAEHHITSWAHSINLTLVHQGAPDSLHHKEWYDDGNKPWRHENLSPSHTNTLPEPWPQTPHAIAEYQWQRSRQDGSFEQPELLLALSKSVNPAVARGANMELWHNHHDVAPALRRSWADRVDANYVLFASTTSQEPLWHTKFTPYADEPARLERMEMMYSAQYFSRRKSLTFLKQLKALRHDMDHLHHFATSQFTWWLATLPPEEMLDGVELYMNILLEHECDPPCHSCWNIHDHNARLIALAIAAEGGAKKLAKSLLKAQGSWLKLLLEAAAYCPEPVVTKALVKLAKQTRTHPARRRLLLALIAHQRATEVQERWQEFREDADVVTALLRHNLHQELGLRASALLRPWLEQIALDTDIDKHGVPECIFYWFGQHTKAEFIKRLRHVLLHKLQHDATSSEASKWTALLHKAGLSEAQGPLIRELRSLCSWHKRLDFQPPRPCQDLQTARQVDLIRQLVSAKGSHAQKQHTWQTITETFLPRDFEPYFEFLFAQMTPKLLEIMQDEGITQITKAMFSTYSSAWFLNRIDLALSWALLLEDPFTLKPFFQHIETHHAYELEENIISGLITLLRDPQNPKRPLALMILEAQFAHRDTPALLEILNAIWMEQCAPDTESIVTSGLERVSWSTLTMDQLQGHLELHRIEERSTQLTLWILEHVHKHRPALLNELTNLDDPKLSWVKEAREFMVRQDQPQLP